MNKKWFLQFSSLLIVLSLVACSKRVPPEDEALRSKLSGKLYGRCIGVQLICSYDLKTSVVTQHPELSTEPDGLPALNGGETSPDGKKSFTEGHKLTNLQNGGVIAKVPLFAVRYWWSSNSRYLVVQRPYRTTKSDSFLNVFIIDADKGDTWSVFGLEDLIDYEDHYGHTLNTPLWSPDDEYLALMLDPPTKEFYLFITTRDGKQITRIGDRPPLNDLRYWGP